MPLLLDKLLPLLVYPLGSALLLVLFAMLLIVLQRRGWALLMLATSVLWLWGWSTPLGARLATQSLERAFPPLAAEQLPLADVIVVLGGGIGPGSDLRPDPDLYDAADRIWHAARLYKAGLAPRVLVTGGNVWPGARESEAAAMRKLLLDLGVPEAAILVEDRSRNTRQNAVESAALLLQRSAADASGADTDADDAERAPESPTALPEVRPDVLPDVLLVTSATHMRRSLATFKTAGFDATAAATDHDSGVALPLALELLPDADALERSTAVIKEYLGLWVYRLRGWA